jgi:hypothetical protein
LNIDKAIKDVIKKFESAGLNLDQNTSSNDGNKRPKPYPRHLKEKYIDAILYKHRFEDGHPEYKLGSCRLGKDPYPNETEEEFFDRMRRAENSSDAKF